MASDKVLHNFSESKTIPLGEVGFTHTAISLLFCKTVILRFPFTKVL